MFNPIPPREALLRSLRVDRGGRHDEAEEGGDVQAECVDVGAGHGGLGIAEKGDVKRRACSGVRELVSQKMSLRVGPCRIRVTLRSKSLFTHIWAKVSNYGATQMAKKAEAREEKNRLDLLTCFSRRSNRSADFVPPGDDRHQRTEEAFHWDISAKEMQRCSRRA